MKQLVHTTQIDTVEKLRAGITIMPEQICQQGTILAAADDYDCVCKITAKVLNNYFSVETVSIIYSS